MPGKGAHNLLFVATEHDSVYAFDADTNAPEPLWHVNLLPNGRGPSRPAPVGDVDCPFINPEVGITSTPVIDLASGMLFVLARARISPDPSAPIYSQQLHALAITTGREKFGGPVEIRASEAGTGEGSSGNVVHFDSLRENPRAALLLNKGVVYLSWASSCDVRPYHGWVMAYDAQTLKQLAVFNTSPDAGESGIWQADTGPAADEEGKVYVSTGNGLFDANAPSGRDYGDTVLKLHLKNNRLVVADFFTPANQQELNAHDDDLGSGGPLLLPDPSGRDVAGLVFGGKQGVLFDINPRKMGGLERSKSASGVDRFPLAHGVYSAPAYWNGRLYTYAAEDSLKAFAVHNGKVAHTPASHSNERSSFSGGTPTISADKARNGIVWVVETRAWNAGGTPAILRAYDALNLSRQLYSSDQAGTRDQADMALRFTIPTVANGRVYVAGASSITVCGLLRGGTFAKTPIASLIIPKNAATDMPIRRSVQTRH